MLALLLLTSCVRHQDRPFSVCYEVELLSLRPEKLWIAYIDSVGEYVSLSTTERQWRKEVVINSGQFAMLYVVVSSGSSNLNLKPHLHAYKRKKQPVISAKIIHERKTIGKYSPEEVIISMHALEAK